MRVYIKKNKNKCRGGRSKIGIQKRDRHITNVEKHWSITHRTFFYSKFVTGSFVTNLLISLSNLSLERLK